MKIYTDGSAHPNPGPGGFGVVVVDDNDNLIDCYSKQTNNTTFQFILFLQYYITFPTIRQ